MKKEIRILIDNKEIEYYELDDYLKNINCVYKDNGKWYIEYKEDKNILEKCDLQGCELNDVQNEFKEKIDILIEAVNEINRRI